MSTAHEDAESGGPGRSMRSGAGWQYAASACLLLLGGALGAAEDEEEKTPVYKLAAWGGVNRLRGEAIVTDTYYSEKRDVTQNYEKTEGGTTTVQTFVLVRVPRESNTGVNWKMETATVRHREFSRYYTTARDGSFTRGGEEGEYRGGVPDDSFSADLDFESERFTFNSASMVLAPYDIVGQGEQFIAGNGRGVEVTPTAHQSSLVEAAVIDQTLPEQVGAVTLVSTIDLSRPKDGHQETRRMRVVLIPMADELEVEVKIDGYEKWRPEGSIASPGQPGNGLAVHAVLKAKSGKAADIPNVARFQFELRDTSREPGVCLNWPLDAKDEDFDLKFAEISPGPSASQQAALRKLAEKWQSATVNPTDPTTFPIDGMPDFNFGAVSADGQKAELNAPRKDKAGRPFADAAIESYDFGGRAELRVTCFLQDGRQITGLLKTASGDQALIRLPRSGDSAWIAESWRQENHAEKLADDADGEEVAGQDDDGDGFTLYEEYRGWAMAGEHVEGDPSRKDFFVLNLIGGSAQAGIDLFEQLSQLRVHANLLPVDMSETDRLMNGNHREGPRRVDQHGVWVKTYASKGELGDEGATTVMTKAGVAGRPAIAKGVGILARDNAESIFKQSFNLPPADVASTYDRAIAHELLHTVGVEHHGPKGDYKTNLFLIVPAHPKSRLSVPYYTESLANYIPLGVLDETGQDLAVKQINEFGWIIDQAHIDILGPYLDKARKDFAIDASYKQASQYASPEVQADVEFYNDMALVYAIKDALVGIEGGAHAGNEACVMRYYFAKLYEGGKGPGKTLYRVTPGTEKIGRQLCRSGSGTGVNAPGRKPVPRYGDAAAGAGNCFAQICPNDGIPPRTVKE